MENNLFYKLIDLAFRPGSLVESVEDSIHNQGTECYSKREKYLAGAKIFEAIKSGAYTLSRYFI